MVHRSGLLVWVLGMAGAGLVSAATSVSPPPNHLTAAETPVSPIDGEYAHLDPDPPQWWSCLRCADYRPTGGAWNLRFFRGRMTLTDQATAWTSHAAFAVDGGVLELSQDPVCPSDRGRYSWRITDEGLTLDPIADPCSFGLRAENLGRGVWSECRPPDARAATSDAWPRPDGCSRPADLRALAPPPPAGVSVIVRSGDSRSLPDPPRVIPANTDNVPAPAGVTIRTDPDVVRYGLYLVLWRNAPWVEATFDETIAPVGVQLWGPSTMGAARVLLDDAEVWRGEVVGLGEHHGQYGGYIEVGGFPAGKHTLRVERLDLDTRPVRVMFFGTG